MVGDVYEFDISQTLLTVFLVLMAIPILMVVLSMTLPARANRVTNLIVASLYRSPRGIQRGRRVLDATSTASAIGLEVLLLAFILRSAWTWPRRTASPATLAASLDSEPLRTPQQA